MKSSIFKNIFAAILLGFALPLEIQAVGVESVQDLKKQKKASADTVVVNEAIVVKKIVVTNKDVVYQKQADTIILDNSGYVGWKRVVPTHIKTQFAGGMGFCSFGFGWDYGKKQQWETDIMFGILQKRYSDRFHVLFSVKQNCIPFSVDFGKNISFQPLTAGFYVTVINGEEYWVKEPSRYHANNKYYGITTSVRSSIYLGEAVTVKCSDYNLLRNVRLYYELSTNDLYLISKITNKCIDLSDIIHFSIGIKFQFLGRRV